jgi:hypothetical protein
MSDCIKIIKDLSSFHTQIFEKDANSIFSSKIRDMKAIISEEVDVCFKEIAENVIKSDSILT